MTTTINWDEKEKEFDKLVKQNNKIFFSTDILTKKDMEKWYNEIDQDYLEDTFTFNNRKFKKLGDVRKHIKTIEDLKKIKKYLDDDSYYYVYDYILDNE